MLRDPIVVLDFETTGLYPQRGARITEVAAVKVVAGKIADEFSTLVNCGVLIPAEITRITGITNEMIHDAPSAINVVKQLASFIGTSMFAAHNVAFDWSFYVAECNRVGIYPNNNTLCTLGLSRRLAPDLRNHKLQNVAAHLDVPFEGNAHRARSDARVAANVLLKFTNQICIDYKTREIDASLLSMVSRWPVRSTAGKLRRALAQKALHSPEHPRQNLSVSGTSTGSKMTGQLKSSRSSTKTRENKHEETRTGSTKPRLGTMRTSRSTTSKKDSLLRTIPKKSRGESIRADSLASSGNASNKKKRLQLVVNQFIVLYTSGINEKIKFLCPSCSHEQATWMGRHESRLRCRSCKKSLLREMSADFRSNQFWRS